jgi:hypothetical protein
MAARAVFPANALLARRVSVSPAEQFGLRPRGRSPGVHRLREAIQISSVVIDRSPPHAEQRGRLVGSQSRLIAYHSVMIRC